MIPSPFRSITPYLRRAVAAAVLLAMAACGGGTADSKTGAVFSVASADTHAAIRAGSTHYGLSKITVTEKNIDASDIGVSFSTAQGSAQPLVPDVANPGQFWLPFVMAPAAGSLSISAPGRATITLSLNLTPFATADAPGTATRDFLQASLSNTNAAAKELLSSRPLPDLLQALSATMALTQLELAWVDKAMQDGTVVMATRRNGVPVRMTTEGLKVLDQMALHSEALRRNQGATPAVAGLAPWRQLIDAMIPSAHAQTSDSAAFIAAARATGDGLGLTVNMVPGVASSSADASRSGADPQAIALNMAGLYAAHYGNALATMQTLSNLTFADPVDNVQIAVSDLFAGMINEIDLPDMDSLTQDKTAGIVREFLDSANNAAVENIVMDEVIIFKTRSVGIQLCPTGKVAVADPDADLAGCVSHR